MIIILFTVILYNLNIYIMKSKRLEFENLVLECIRNKKPSNPYIDISDITHYLFLHKRLGDVSRGIMRKKLRAKKHHAKSLITTLILKQKITVISYMDLHTYIIPENNSVLV